MDSKENKGTVMNNLTIISCSYNSPWLLRNMIHYIKKFYDISDILICENSDNVDDLKENVLFLENEGIKYIINNYKKRQHFDDHAHGVRLLFDNVKTKYALLLDTDIELKKNINDILDMMESNNAVAAGYIGNRLNTRTRIYPWFMLVNIEMIKKYELYFNEEQVHSEYTLSEQNKPRPDTGSQFLEECFENKLPVLKINDVCEDYNHTPWHIHHEGLSWSEKRSENAIFTHRQNKNIELKERWKNDLHSNN